MKEKHINWIIIISYITSAILVWFDQAFIVFAILSGTWAISSRWFARDNNKVYEKQREKIVDLEKTLQFFELNAKSGDDHV